jgi:hypothetical protein
VAELLLWLSRGDLVHGFQAFTKLYLFIEGATYELRPPDAEELVSVDLQAEGEQPEDGNVPVGVMNQVISAILNGVIEAVAKTTFESVVQADAFFRNEFLIARSLSTKYVYAIGPAYSTDELRTSSAFLDAVAVLVAARAGLRNGSVLGHFDQRNKPGSNRVTD